MYFYTKEIDWADNYLYLFHRLINNTDRTLVAVFSRFRGFSFHNNPEAEAQMSYTFAVLNYKTESEYAACNSFGPLPLSYCERKIPKS